jgi:hypothetical protein
MGTDGGLASDKVLHPAALGFSYEIQVENVSMAL